MRTEHDLRDAIQAIADRAPSAQEADLIIPGDDGPRRPARRRLQLAVVVATAAAVAVPVLLLNRDSSPTPADGEDILRNSVEVRAEGWSERSRAMLRTHQWVGLVNGRDNNCVVIVYEPGAFDPDRIPRGSAPLTVGGKTGYYAEIVGPLSQNPLEALAPSPSTAPPSRSRVVLWRYADDAWAASRCTRGPSMQESRRDSELVANGTVVRSQPVRIPVKLGHLPAGLELVTGILDQPERVAGKPPAGTLLELEFLDLRRTSPVGAHLTIRYTTGFPLDTSGGVEKLSINGRQAVFSGASLMIGDERATVSLDAYSADGSRDELIRIAGRLEFAPDPTDTSTWFDSEDALP